jgi:hypothetical protein
MTPCDAPYTFACGTDQAARNSCTSGNGSFNIQAGIAGVVIGAQVETTSSTDCRSEKPTTIRLGAGLGVPLAVAAIAAVGFFCLWRRAENKGKKLGVDWVEEPVSDGIQL